MKRMSRTCPAIAEPSRAEKCSGVQSRIAAFMRVGKRGVVGPAAADCTNTIRGSPITAPSRVKLVRTVT